MSGRKFVDLVSMTGSRWTIELQKHAFREYAICSRYV